MTFSSFKETLFNVWKESNHPRKGEFLDDHLDRQLAATIKVKDDCVKAIVMFYFLPCGTEPDDIKILSTVVDLDNMSVPDTVKI